MYIIHVRVCTNIHVHMWICVEGKDVVSQGPFTLFCEAGSLTETSNSLSSQNICQNTGLKTGY